VTNLFDGFVNAGSHSVNFDASEMASGTYFVSLKSGEFSDSKKMTLIK